MGGMALAVAPQLGQASAVAGTSAPHLGHLTVPLSTVVGRKHIDGSFFEIADSAERAFQRSQASAPLRLTVDNIVISTRIAQGE